MATNKKSSKTTQKGKAAQAVQPEVVYLIPEAELKQMKPEGKAPEAAADEWVFLISEEEFKAASAEVAGDAQPSKSQRQRPRRNPRLRRNPERLMTLTVRMTMSLVSTAMTRIRMMMRP